MFQYDVAARSLEETRVELDNWTSANSELRELQRRTQEALEARETELQAREQLIQELEGDLEVLKEDLAKTNAITNAKDSELSG